MILIRVWRQSVLILVACLSFSSALAADAMPQKNTKKYRIGMLLYRGETDAERGFSQFLIKQGVDAEFIIKDAAEDAKRLPQLVKELRTLHPDLIYSFGTTATLALSGKQGQVSEAQHVTDIPIVFNIVADPVGSGIATNLNHPGRNVTGVTHLVPLSSQLSALKSTADIRTIGIIYSAKEKNAALSAESLEQAAKEFGFVVNRYPIGNANTPPDLVQLDSVLKNIQIARPQLVYMPSDSFLIQNASRVSKVLQEAKILSMSATEGPIRQDGFVMGLVSPYSNAGALAGYKAHQILVEGIDPGDVPISGLDKFTFIINMKSALDIGFYPKIRALGFAEVINVPTQISKPRPQSR